jgi:Enolase C-terminal domain-like/Mandelate racemase / muconate lactonizing enzyme, N-terminal domain
MTRGAGHGADGVAKVSAIVDVKVRELRVRAVRVPMNPPHKTASGVVGESPLVLTDAVFDNGGVGHGMVFTYTTAALEPTARLVKNLEPLVGDKMAIMVDYNQSLVPADAVERMSVLDDYGLAWVEEPTLAHDYRGHAYVAREARTPIQCGENW